MSGYELLFSGLLLPETPEVCPKVYNSVSAGEVRFKMSIGFCLGF